MKKVILTSIFSLFLIAGAGLLLNATETERKQEAKTSCCSATAEKTSEAATCAGKTTAEKSEGCCSGEKSAEATAIQTSNAEKKEGCCSSAAEASVEKAVETSKAAGSCSGGSVQTIQTASSQAGECVKRPAGLRAQQQP
jgi:hypothetical protein